MVGQVTMDRVKPCRDRHRVNNRISAATLAQNANLYWPFLGLRVGYPSAANKVHKTGLCQLIRIGVGESAPKPENAKYKAVSLVTVTCLRT